MRTELIEYDKLYNLLIAWFIAMFGEQCERLIKYPISSTTFEKDCQKYELLPNGLCDNKNYGTSISKSCIKNLSPYIQGRINLMSRKFKELDLDNPNKDILRDLVFWSKKMYEEIIKDNQVTIETTVFISPLLNYKSVYHSIYHNTRLCALSPLDYDTVFMSNPLYTPFGVSTGIGVGKGLVNQIVNFVYSKAFDDYYQKIRHDEYGRLIRLNMSDVIDFDTMGIDGTDFIDMTDVARAYDSWSAGRIFKEVMDKLNKKKQEHSS